MNSQKCARHPHKFAIERIGREMRAVIDGHGWSIEGVAQDMEIDDATLRRYLSAGYGSTLPCHLIHRWYQSTEGDLSPVRSELLKCGYDAVPLPSGRSEIGLAEAHALLAEQIRATQDLLASFADRLNDRATPGKIDPNEARELLPKFDEALRKLFRGRDACLAISEGRE